MRGGGGGEEVPYLGLLLVLEQVQHKSTLGVVQQAEVLVRLVNGDDV